MSSSDTLPQTLDRARMMSDAHRGLLATPPEIILRIFSYLDIPDLAALAAASGYLAVLAADPVLHRARILVVAPSRVSHSLFAVGPEGAPLRPSVPELVHRGVMRGLGIERHWRMGLYFYSPLSVTHYETSVRLQRRYASNIVASNLRQRPRNHAMHMLYTSHVFPDVESSTPWISRSLLPVMRKLKWCIRRDGLAKMVRDGKATTGEAAKPTIAQWIERRGTILVGESERVRLAICPGIKNLVTFYEHLAEEL
ncbi:hypothetical protein FA95DRAFT_1557055 [Auriscalpium vulgare]|uniref:Uncharacterized protein n=1 Tax=Auriscalpium vulgare TaxID=40419 RepID=A0ACB8RYK9_9AGAM|nr:hypothetical protein FA95DRAFT_1557055 [Auriscalpium vulgare]